MAFFFSEFALTSLSKKQLKGNLFSFLFLEISQYYLSLEEILANFCKRNFQLCQLYLWLVVVIYLKGIYPMTLIC